MNQSYDCCVIAPKKRKHKNYSHPEKPRHVHLEFAQPPSSAPEQIRVVTYNIRLSKKIPKAIRVLSSHPPLKNADIIFLQEMDLAGVVQIAHALKMNYAYYPAIVHPRLRQDFGNAILSRWPMADDKKVIFPQKQENRLQRIAVKATVNIHGKKIRVCSLHMKVFLKAKQRGEQVAQLLSMLPDDVDAYIVAGDFNTFTKKHHTAVKEKFQEKGFLLVTEEAGWSYTHWYLLNKKNLLDHIYIKNLTKIETGNIKDKSASDHLPIWAVLK